MSNITKELAKLFRKITNSEIDADGNAHVVLSPADSLLINNARIALASLEAEAVHQVYGNSDDTWSDVDEDEMIRLSSDGEDTRTLYTAPPAPVSVPAAMEIDDDFDSAFEHGKAVGWNACRAAMLQSFGNSEQLNSPVIPDGWVAVPVEPTIAILDEFDSIIDYGAEDSKDAWSRLLAAAWIKSLPAAPQQEA